MWNNKILLLLQYAALSNAFYSHIPSTSFKAKVLKGHENNDTNESSRRDWMAKSSGAAILTSSTLLNPFLSNDHSIASAADEGKLIEFQVDNLNGVAGKTGKFVVKTRPDWAPLGVAQFEDLASNSFWDECRIFRVIPNFISQFGINGNPTIQAKYRKAIKDDPVKVTNARGTVVFATAGPNTRTTQLFINTRPQGNGFLDRQGFSPIGEVVEGMDVVDAFYDGYGEGAPSGKGPNQGLIQAKGNEYLIPSFPKLTYISKATIL